MRTAIVLALMLAGCGAPDAARALDTPAADPSPTPSPVASPTPAPLHQLEQPASAPVPAACQKLAPTTVSNVVAVSVTLPALDTAVVWSSTIRTWGAAMAATPPGFHLATRAEVMALFDAGWLKNAPNDLPLYSFWTSNEDASSGGVSAWLFDASDAGATKIAAKTAQLPAIYVPEAAQP